MSRIFSLALVLSIFVILVDFGCRGYKGTTSKNFSEKEIQITDMSGELVDQSEQFLKAAPPDIADMANEFNERAKTYNNACLRFGPDTLDARSAFDRLWYQTAQLDKTINEQSYGDLYNQWVAIRDQYVKKIGRTLGYRMPQQTSS
jgi:hypothetical protein